jgi:hypothetical protein
MGDTGEERDEDGFGTFYRTKDQVEQAQVELDQPDATDDVTWSPPTTRPMHSEPADDPAAEETIDERIAQEEPERGSAYGAPEAGGVLGGADDPADQGPSLGGDDPDAIPADTDFLGTATSDVT